MENIIEKKYSTSLRSSTPLEMEEKWVRKLNWDTRSIIQSGAHPDIIVIMGVNPDKMKNKQATTAIMKLMTWLRVSEDVMLPTLKKAPAIKMLPR